MTSAISPFASALRRGVSRLGGTMAAFLFSLALAGCGGGGGGSGFLGDAGGNVGDGAEPGASVVLDSGEGITEERRQGVAVKVAGLDLGGEGKVRAEDVQVSEDPEILNQNPFATAETAPETVAEARGFERQSVEEERKTPGYKAFEVAVPADNPLMTVAVWISETAPEEEVELPEGKPERDPEAPRKFLYVRLQVYVSTRNFAAVEGGGVEVLETQVIAVEERLPDPKPPAGADECEAAGWKAARVDGNAINCLIPLTSGGKDFEGCVLSGEFEPLCSEVFGEDFVFPTKLGGEARYVFNCGEGMIPEGVNLVGATQCFSEAAVNCAAGSLPANGMTQGDLNVALRLAARRGDAGQVCEMLRRGAEVNDDLNGTEFTALQEAVSEGHLGVAELLLANGAEVNARKEGAGPSALDLAARAKNAEIAAVLRAAEGRCFVESGGLCEEAVVAGVCAAGSLGAGGLTEAQLLAGLISAVQGNDLTGACEYLRRGADINARNESGLFPLMYTKEVEMVRLLLDNGANFSAQWGGRAWSPLYFMAYRWDTVGLYMERGLDPNVGGYTREGDQWKPLHEAAYYGQWRTMKLMLEAGADPNVHSRRGGWNGRTPLHEAVGFQSEVFHGGYRDAANRPAVVAIGNSELAVSVLLAAGARVNALDGSGRSALDVAAGRGKEAAAAVLRAAGGRCFVRTGPLCGETVATPEPVVSTVVASDTVCTAGSLSANGMTQAQLDAGLLSAAAANNMAGVCEYLRRGANVDAEGPSDTMLRETALINAAVYGRLEMARLLLNNGADVGAKVRDRGKSDMTALIYASAAGHADVVELLLDEGAEIDATDSRRRGAVYEAAHWGRLDVLELLLSRGVNAGVRDRTGETVLHGVMIGNTIKHLLLRAEEHRGNWVVFWGHTVNPDDARSWAGALEVLLTADGVEVNTRMNDGRSALDYAAQFHSGTDSGFPELAELLRDAGGRCFVRTGPLCEVAVATPEPVVSTVVASDTVCTAGSLSANGKTQTQLDAGLISAVRGDNLEDACEYLRRGANVGARETSVPSGEHYRKTGLIIAAYYGQLEMAKLLLNNGAEVDQIVPVAGHRGGIRALSYAFRDPEIVKLLLDRGADVDMQEENGRNPLFESAAWGFWKSVKLLLDRGANPNLLDDWGLSALYGGGVTGKRNIGTNGYVRFTGWRRYDLTPLQSWPKVVSLLLAAGADVNAREGTGQSSYTGYPGYSSLDFAARMRYSEIAEMLRNAGGRCFVRTGPLCEVAVATPEPVVSTVVTRDTVCTAGTLAADGKTQAQLDAGLISAARADNLEDACEYLRRGANVDAQESEWRYYKRTPLMIAATDGNLELGKLLRRNGADVNFQGGNYRNDIDSAPPSNGDRKTPALHYAAGAGHKDFVEWLLSEGADLHAEQIALGRDTLWEAAFWGRTEIVKLLLSRGGNPNNQSRWTAAPLGSVIHHATHRALYGSPRWGIADTFPVPTQSDWATVISLLVAGGADVNIRFGGGESPLDMAVSRNSAKYAEQIRGYGGRCFVRSGPLCEATVATPVTGDTVCAAGTLAADGMTQAELDAGMLNSVFNSDLDEVCDYLRRGANIAAHTAAGHPALVMVQSNLEMAKLLLANGADPNQRESFGARWPPVMFVRQSADVIALYLSHGADPNAGVLNGNSWKPLHEAAYYNEWRVMEALVSGGADPNVQTTRSGWRGGAPLHYVFDGTRADSGLAVSVLLAGGAEVNARDNGGRSGLDLAARQGDADAAAVLRGAGGVCFVETGPLCEVEVAAPEPVVGTVVASDTVCTAGSLSANGMTQTELHAGLVSAVKAGDMAGACEHLRRGADVNGGDANGYSALMHAGANLEMGGLLLANGAEVHTQWPNGRGWWTPLYMHGHPDAIEFYLSHGADPDVGWHNSTWTPLHEAAYYNKWRAMEILLGGGADPDIQTTRSGWRGGAPLHYIFDGSRANSGRAVSVLVSGGAEVNARDNRGRSGLDLAARQGDADAAAVLRDAGGVCFVETGPLCEVEVATPEPVVGTVVASDTVCTAGSLSADGLSQRRLNAGLIAAARGNDLAGVCEYLRRGANVDAQESEWRYYKRTPLMIAAMDGNLELGKLLRRNGADVNLQVGNYNNSVDAHHYQGNRRMPALHYAAGAGRKEFVEWLLSEGANVRALQALPRDALWEAAFWGRPEIVRILLTAGADANKLATGENLALWDAVHHPTHWAKYGNPRWGVSDAYARPTDEEWVTVISILVANGADVNVREPQGASPLDIAVRRGNAYYAELMREYGSRCFVETGPLCEVAVATPEPVVSTVVTRDTVCTAGSLSANGKTQAQLDAGLISAAKENDLPKVCEHLRRGADIEARENTQRFRRTALMIAASDGFLDLAKLLHANGANVNRQAGNHSYGGGTDDSPGWSALHYAATAGHANIVSWLLDSGADVDARWGRGGAPIKTALWEASFWGRADVVEILLSRGADPEGGGGPLPLHGAAIKVFGGGAVPSDYVMVSYDRVEADSGAYATVVSLLASRVSDVNRRVGNNWSALDYAARDGQTRIAGVLRDFGGRCFVRTGPLCEVATATPDPSEVVATVVANDAVCTAGSLSANGKTQRQLDAGLISAAKANDLPGVCEHLRRGADIEARENTQRFRRTALMIAASDGFLDLAKLLYANGANVNRQAGNHRGWHNDSPGWSALHYAATAGHANIVSWLLDSGADVDARWGWGGVPGKSVLWEAAHWGRADVVKILLDRGADPEGGRDPWPLHGAAIKLFGGNSAPSDFVMVNYSRVELDSEGYATVVSLLASRVSDVNWHTGNNWTALDYAANEGQTRIAGVLRDLGGRCFVKTGPLCEVATATPDPAEVIATVVASDTVCAAGSLSANGMTQAQLDAGLIAAAGEGDLTTACEYLRRGANPNGRDAHQHVPLMHAKAHLDMGELLLANGADKYVQIDGNGWWSPLFPLGGIYTAAQIEFYLSRGVDPNFGSLGGDDYDWRPLHEAAFYGKWNAIKHLLDGGAVPNVHTSRPGWRGRTPLHEAVGDSSDSFHFAIDASNPPFGMIVGNSARAVSVLLEGGAEVNARDGRGYSPLDRAAVYSKTAAAAVLRAAGGRCFVRTGPLCGEARVAVEYSSAANGTVSADVASGGEVARGATVAFTATPAEGFYVSGWTGGCVDAVAGSVGDGGAKVCSLIAEAALSVGAVFAEVPSLAGPECPGGTMPGNGLTQAELNTQLRLAARNGDTRKICEMLRRGAEVNDNLGGNEFTALQEAVSGGHKAAAEMLLANDAHVNARKGGSGPAPLDLAAQNENAEIAQILRDAHGQCFVATGPLCGEYLPAATLDPSTVAVTATTTATVAIGDLTCPTEPLSAEGSTGYGWSRVMYRSVKYSRAKDYERVCRALRQGGGSQRLCGRRRGHAPASRVPKIVHCAGLDGGQTRHGGIAD